MGTRKKLEPWQNPQAVFDARALLMLDRFRDKKDRAAHKTDCVLVRPHPSGGVLAAAMDGFHAGFFHDPEGRCLRAPKGCADTNILIAPSKAFMACVRGIKVKGGRTFSARVALSDGWLYLDPTGEFKRRKDLTAIQPGAERLGMFPRLNPVLARLTRPVDPARVEPFEMTIDTFKLLASPPRIPGITRYEQARRLRLYNLGLSDMIFFRYKEVPEFFGVAAGLDEFPYDVDKTLEVPPFCLDWMQSLAEMAELEEVVARDPDAGKDEDCEGEDGGRQDKEAA